AAISPIAICYSGDERESMRDCLAVVAACAALIACAPAQDTAHVPIFLPSPSAPFPTAPPDTPIEPGRPVRLNARQQQAVMMGVVKWMKDPASIQFRGVEAAQNSRSRIAVCGLVNGRNTAGQFVGFQPLVGLLMGPGADADFL